MLAFAAETSGWKACIARPGLITAPGKIIQNLASRAAGLVGFPKVENAEVAAAMLEQVVNWKEIDTLENDDLVSIGKQALTEKAKV